MARKVGPTEVHSQTDGGGEVEARIVAGPLPTRATAPPSVALQAGELQDVLASEPSRQKVKQLGIKQEPGVLLRLNELGVFRIEATARADRRGNLPADLLKKVRVKMEEDHVYFVDVDGDIARLPREAAEKLMLDASWRGRKPLAAPLSPTSVTLKSGQEYRVLSIHGPWAWAIIFGGKDVENRSWSTEHRGPILIHASSRKFSGAGLVEVRGAIARCSGMPLAEVPVEFPRSTMLGMVDVADCRNSVWSPWGAPLGQMNWVLENPRRLTPAVSGIDGKLNLWSWACP